MSVYEFACVVCVVCLRSGVMCIIGCVMIGCLVSEEAIQTTLFSLHPRPLVLH